MTLTAAKLRAVANLLSDPMQAGAAAHVLAREAKERSVLVADLIATALAPAPPTAPPPSAPSAAPSFRDVEPIDDGGPIVKRINDDHIGLIGAVIDETGKAWCIETPNATPAWLPKSQCEHHGEDPLGRTILVVPAWLARRARLL